MLLVCAGEFGLSCQESVLCGVKKSAVMLSRREDLVLIVGSGDR